MKTNIRKPRDRSTAGVARPLEALGLSPAAAGIIRFFLLRPGSRHHTRGIQRTLGFGSASIQRELGKLVSMGALERVEEGNRAYHGMRPEHRLWTACSLMIETTEDPAPILRDALQDVSGVRAAFLFGSMADGRSGGDSDLDVFLLEGPSKDRTRGLRQLAEAGLLLGREVNTIRYTERSLAERLGEAAHPGAAFVRKVLTGPKRWVAGSPAALLPLATAAGLKLSHAEDETP